MADDSFRIIEVHFSAKNLNFNFSKPRPPHPCTACLRHAPTSRTALHCLRAGRAHASRCTQATPAGCCLQMAETKFETTEVQNSGKYLDFPFSELRPAHLHPARHRHAPTARIALQCVRADGAHEARAARTTLVGCFEQLANVSFRTVDVQFSEKTLTSNFPNFALSIC